MFARLVDASAPSIDRATAALNESAMLHKDRICLGHTQAQVDDDMLARCWSWSQLVLYQSCSCFRSFEFRWERFLTFCWHGITPHDIILLDSSETGQICKFLCIWTNRVRANMHLRLACDVSLQIGAEVDRSGRQHATGVFRYQLTLQLYRAKRNSSSHLSPISSLPTICQPDLCGPDSLACPRSGLA